MSSSTGLLSFTGLGFAIEFVRTTIERGPNMESFYNGMFGALGALIIKLSYDLVKYLIKQHKQNVQQQGKIE